MSDYDVIVIGSGAGGGTLVHRLAPSGKRILLLERGDWLPREPQNWSAARRLRRQPLRLAGHLVRRRRQAVPAAGALLRRRRDEALRRGAVPPARGGLRRAAPPRRRLAGVADRLRRDGAVLHAGRAALPGARRPRGGPDRAARERALSRSPPVSHEPRIQQLSDDLAAAGLPPVPRAVRRACSTSPTCPTARCVRCPNCDGFPCLVHAKSDAEVLGGAPGARARQRDAADRARRPCASSTDAAGHDGHRRRRRPRRRGARRFTADLVVVSCGAANSATAAARVGERRATRTGWPTAPTRSGATTCSTTARRCWRCRASPTRPCSRRRSGVNDFYFASDDFDYPLGNIQMVGKSSGADVPRREAARDASLAPTWTLERRRPPRRRLLALDRGPAASREPRDARPRRQRQPRATRRTNDVPKQRLLPRSSSRCSAHLGHAPRPPAAAPRLPQERDPGRRLSPTRRAPAGSAAIRPPRCSTPIAAPTRSTTSTSSTRASSRASAR